MGADMLLYILPACKITEKRRKVLCDLAAAVSQDQIPNEYENPEDWRIAIAEAIDWVAECADRRTAPRDVVTCRLEGMPYAAHFTGGLSWGDTPTDSSDRFALFEACAALYDQLREWAIEDALNSPRRT